MKQITYFPANYLRKEIDRIHNLLHNERLTSEIAVLATTNKAHALYS